MIAINDKVRYRYTEGNAEYRLTVFVTKVYDENTVDLAWQHNPQYGASDIRHPANQGEGFTLHTRKKVSRMGVVIVGIPHSGGKTEERPYVQWEKVA